MNLKSVNLIKNASYTVSSNLLSFIVSALVAIFIPRLLGVAEYSYWQLYIFYSSYVGFLHFGWNDGIYLRYGGEIYEKLNKSLMKSQFYQLFVFQLIIGVSFWFISSFLELEPNRYFIVVMVSITMIMINTRQFVYHLLQATNRIKDFALINILDRVVYISLIALFLLIGIRDYKYMILADMIVKLITFVIAIYSIKDILIERNNKFYLSINEVFANINIGIKLMFANIASILIIGSVKFGIERTWDVETFGKVSLTLSISNMMMIFINAIGLMMFPVLRRTSDDKLKEFYTVMRDFLMSFVLAILVIYYPFKNIMTIWLPQYTDSLIYMALVFPIFIYEGRMALLINTYLKTLRKERVMLKVNTIGMLMSILLTFITTQIFDNLNLTILIILLLLLTRALLAEIYLTRLLGINLYKDITLEVLITIIFILAGWYINSWNTFYIHLISYIFYILIKYKNLILSYKKIKNLVIV